MVPLLTCWDSERKRTGQDRERGHIDRKRTHLLHWRKEINTEVKISIIDTLVYS